MKKFLAASAAIAAGELPHAMHLHGEAQAGDEGCPAPAAAGRDGVVTTLDGLPSYGGILASLTTSGDTSPASAVDLDRFPVASGSGRLCYRRTFTTDVHALAGRVQVVVHGIDFDDNGTYAFGEGCFASRGSSLDPAIPLEATVPVLCAGIAN